MEELLRPLREQQELSKELLTLLIKYYKNAYNYNFISLANVYIDSLKAILVLPTVTIYRRIKISDEVFGSTYSKRYKKSAKILTKFILDNNITDIYLGVIQYYFKYQIQLSEHKRSIY